jgi:ATP-dependent helicase/nuclease subunit B
MAGWLYLHSYPEIGAKMDLPGATEWSDSDTIYLYPSLKQMGLKTQENQLTFDRFVRACLPETGRRLMTPAEQQWIVLEAMQRTDRAKPLTALAMILNGPGGGVSLIEQVIGELKRSGVSPDRLKRLWENRDQKYQELASIYENYQALLREQNLWDHEEPYLEWMRSFYQEPERILLPKRLVLLRFHELNRLQELLLGLLVTRVEIHVHLMVPKGRERLGNLMDPVIKRLNKRGFQIEKKSGPARRTVRRDSLMHLLEHVFSDDPPLFHRSDGLEVIAAPGIAAEVEMVVARLKKWLLAEKSDLTDAVILTSEHEVYAPLFYQKLDEAGIPVRTEERQTLSAHPLLQTIHAVFSVRMEGGKWLKGLLHSPFLPWLERDRSKCAEWMKRLDYPARLSDLSSKWDKVGTPEDERVYTALKEWFTWIESIPKKQAWLQWGKWFREWIRPLKRLDRWRKLAAEQDQVWLASYEMKGWHALVQIMDQWKNLMEGIRDDKEVTDRQFIQFLMQMAERFEVRVREGERRGIRILEANQVFSEPVRAVFMVGLAEGRWPRPFADHWLIPDRERARLRSEGILLDYSSELRQRQLLPFFTGIALATDLLVLSYPHTDEEGKKQLPSPFLEDCSELFSEVKKRSLDVPERIRPANWDLCFSDERGLALALHQLRNENRLNEGDKRPALEMLRRALLTDQAKGHSLLGRIDAERKRWSSKFTEYDGIIPHRLAGQIEKEVWSASALNRLVECRFQFLASQLWKSSEKEAPQRGFSRQEEGEWVHEILCRFFHEYRQGQWTFADEEMALARLEQIADHVLHEHVSRDGGRQRDPFYVEIDRLRLKQKLLSFWEHEKQWRRQTALYTMPAHLELSFGLPFSKADVERGRLDPDSIQEPVTLTLAGGRKLRLQGKMDRIDCDEEGYYAIYDYKTGTVPTTEEIKQGRSLQLPLYLWAYQQGFGQDPALAIGSAYYAKGNGGSGASDQRNKGLWCKGESARVGVKARKVLDRNEWEQMEENIQQLIDRSLSKAEQGDYSVSPTWDCPRFCPARHICRIDAWILSQKRGSL